MRALRRWALAALVVLLATTAWTQEPEPEEAGGLKEDENRARIESADLLTYDPAEAVYHLSGNVVFSHRDIKLYCDEATYDYDENSAVATGNPRVVTEDTTVTGTVIEADFDAEVVTIADKVTVVTQRKRENGQQEASSDEEPRTIEDYWEKKTTITCDRIVYEYADDVKRITATGRVKAVQEDKTVYADQAVYQELEDLITLTGNVRVITDRGDEFRCPRAVISVAEDWIRAEQVTGVGKRREQQEEEQTPPESSAPEAPNDQSQQPEGGESSGAAD